MLNITKTTPCGRFTVTIVSAPINADAKLTSLDVYTSLKNLADVLDEAKVVALKLSVKVLAGAGSVF